MRRHAGPDQPVSLEDLGPDHIPVARLDPARVEAKPVGNRNVAACRSNALLGEHDGGGIGPAHVLQRHHRAGIRRQGDPLAIGNGAADRPFLLRFTGQPQRSQQPGPRPRFREARATQDVLPSIPLGVGLLQVAPEASEIADHTGTAGAETAEEPLRIR